MKPILPYSHRFICDNLVLCVRTHEAIFVYCHALMRFMCPSVGTSHLWNELPPQLFRKFSFPPSFSSLIHHQLSKLRLSLLSLSNQNRSIACLRNLALIHPLDRLPISLNRNTTHRSSLYCFVQSRVSW